MRNLLLWFVPSVALIAFFLIQKPIGVAKSLTDADYEIYSLYVNETPPYKNVPGAGTSIIDSTTNLLVRAIHPKTTWSWTAAHLGDQCKSLNDTARCRKAQEPIWTRLFEQVKQLPQTERKELRLAKFSVNRPLQLRSQVRRKWSDDQADSLRYYLFSVSSIVYNEDKTKALFFGSFGCGGNCGSGELVMVEKVGKNWILIDTFRFWIA